MELNKRVILPAIALVSALALTSCAYTPPAGTSSTDEPVLVGKGHEVSMTDGGKQSCAPILALLQNPPKGYERQWWNKFLDAVKSAQGKSTNAELEKLLPEYTQTLNTMLSWGDSYLATDATRAVSRTQSAQQRDLWDICMAYTYNE